MAGRFDDNNKRIHAQRKFAQGAAVLPSRESLREIPVPSPSQREPDHVIPRICNDTAEDLLTKLCFHDWVSDMVPETMSEIPLKNPVVLLSDVLKNPPDAKQPKERQLKEKQLKEKQLKEKQIKAKQLKVLHKRILPFSVRKSASKFPLTKPNLKRKIALQKLKENAATKDVTASPKRKTLRSALKDVPKKIVSTSKDIESTLLSLRNRNVNKKTTSISKVRKVQQVNVVSPTSKTRALNKYCSPPPQSPQASHKESRNKRNKPLDSSGSSKERSFNDSDEEPLAQQVKKKKKVQLKQSKVVEERTKRNTRNTVKRCQLLNKHTKPTEISKDLRVNVNDIYEFHEEAELAPVGKISNSFVPQVPNGAVSEGHTVTVVQYGESGRLVQEELNGLVIHSEPSRSNDLELTESDVNVDSTRLPDVENVTGNEAIPEVPPECLPSSSSNVDTLHLITDIKSEDNNDVTFVNEVGIPTIPLQKQLESIMQQVADLKNTVELTSNKKNASGSKQSRSTPRAYIKPSQRGKAKGIPETIPKILPANKTAFPKPIDSAEIVEAPVFMPTEQEFRDPFDYIEKITPYASQFGIARIIPPASFQPECRLADDIRFTSNKQFIHRMRSRWGPSTRDMVAITSYLKTQQISLDPPPTIGGLDADLPRLYQVVEEMGGVKEVMDNWTQVATAMNIPKLIPNPKLQEMYFKYILPFVTLSEEEREGYFKKANVMWAAAKAKKKNRRGSNYSSTKAKTVLDDENNYKDVVVEEMDCVTKGKSMNYSVFTRMCKNAMNMWFGSSHSSGNVVPEPKPEVVEKEFWKIVDKVDRHVVVHSASINTGDLGIGFPDPTEKNDLSKKHPWNLKVMCNNPASVLRSMGTLMGVSIPTLHVGMVFSTSCWYRDPHGLPWIEYLHMGSPKIWYGLPESEGERFKAGFKNLAPFTCKDKKIWLPSDTTMIPPDMLRDTGVSLCRTVQHSGEYILVFPKAYSSSICTGSCVSESVYLSPYSWLATAYHDFEDLHGSCEPSLFSMEHLLISIAEDSRSTTRLLMHSQTLLSIIFEREKENRGTLRSLNIPLDERPARCEEGAPFPGLERARRGEDTEECDVCRQRLHLSHVYDLNDDDQVYCLPHAIELITNKTVETYSNAVVHCKYSSAQLSTILKRLIDRLTIDIRGASSSQNTHKK